MEIKVPSDFLADITNKFSSNETKLFTYETWYRYMFPYIPFKTGVLASTTHLKYYTGEMIKTDIDGKKPSVTVSEEGILFDVPYASRQYTGDNFNFSKEQHPLAQARWGEVAMDIHGNAIANEVKNFLLR
jgi:hypothetical protein